MSPYATAGWETFFVAEVGAAAALTGLLFVAVSINLAKVLAFPQLPGRAGESLMMLMSVLVIASFGLIPGQPRVALGAEILAVAALVWICPMVLQKRAVVPNAPLHWTLTRAVTHQMGTIPLVVCGVSLLTGVGGGLYWLAAGALLSFISASLNAWVLLVEIQR
jgi:hypothetical protein